MIAGQENISRDKEVSSVETREWMDNVRYELSTLYHRSLAMSSEINALGAMVTLTEKPSVPILRKYIDEISISDADYIITASTEPVFPTVITDMNKAERHIEFGSICSKKVDSISVFTDSSGDMKPNIKVVRSTLIGLS